MFQAALFTMCAASNLGFPLAIGNAQIFKKSNFLVKYWDEMVQSLEHVKYVFSQIAIFLWVYLETIKAFLYTVFPQIVSAPVCTVTKGHST